MAETEEEIKTPIQEECIKDVNESEDNKVAFECASIGSSLEIDNLLELQEEAKEDGTKTDDGKALLAEKDALIETIKNDINSLESSKGETEKLLAESEKVVEQLKGKIQRQKEFEKRLYDSFLTQTSQLEQAQLCINKWKQKMASVEENGEGITSYEENYWLRLQVERLENEAGIQRNGKNPWEEVKRLRKELELAIEAEENSKTAMDDLAVVIKEVAAESNQVKEKLDIMKEEIETKEKTHQLALGEARKENESLKATINRLRESLPSLNGKETEFVDSIKRAEEEKVDMQEENNRLVRSLNEEKEESRKIREVVKQIKVENAKLKEALTQESERLKKSESTTNENMKELIKQMWPPHSRKDSKKDSCAIKGSRVGRGRSTEDLKSCGMAAGSFCSIPLHVPRLSSKQKGEVHDSDDSLTGSIFEIVQPSSVEPRHTRSTSATILTDDENSIHSEEFETSERSCADHMEIEKESHSKKKVKMKKFSELWRRKSHNHTQPHNLNQDHKEVAIE